MLKTGVPLEGALKQLCADMQRGQLREELARLENDLTQGTPLCTAIAKRNLPELYVRMIQIGVKSNDLPGVLILIADYYQRMNSLKTRLKTLMVYPGIVLGISFFVTVLVALLFHTITSQLMDGVLGSGSFFGLSFWPFLALILFPAFFGLIFFSFLLAFLIPSVKRKVVGCLPGFKDAHLANLARSMSILLRGGCSLSESISLLAPIQTETQYGKELEQWQKNVISGQGQFKDFASSRKYIPSLFYWIVINSGEECAAGLAQAAEIYYERAMQRMEICLYAVVPISIVIIGLMIGVQILALNQGIFRALYDSLFICLD